jgi:hypothetical protein
MEVIAANNKIDAVIAKTYLFYLSFLFALDCSQYIHCLLKDIDDHQTKRSR